MSLVVHAMPCKPADMESIGESGGAKAHVILLVVQSFCNLRLERFFLAFCFLGKVEILGTLDDQSFLHGYIHAGISP